MHARFGDMVQLYDSYRISIILILFYQGDVHESFILFKSGKLKFKVYR